MRQVRDALKLAPAPTNPGFQREEFRPEFRTEEFQPKEFRPLGAFENFFAAYSEEAITTFTMMVELEGEITKTAIERALAQVQARHPLLGVGIGRDANGRRTFVRSTRPIPLKELPTGAVPWELAAGLELRRRFDVEEGPLMLASVRFEPKSVRMFFTFHHSIADGMSGAFVIQDFARALNGERIGTFIDAATLDRRLVRLPRANPIGPEEPVPTHAQGVIDPEVAARWGRGMSATPAVSARAFAPDFTRRLREVARFHDATVHSALSVALSRAMGEIRGAGRPVRLMSPISVRATLGIKDECGLFVAGGHTVVDPAGNSFWDEARTARASLAGFMNSDVLHDMNAAMMAFRDNDDSYAGAKAGFAAAFDCDAILTNLGALPIRARHGRIRIKAITGPIALGSFEDEHVVGVATLEDQMQLTYVSVTPLPRLLERVERNLVEACAGW